MMALASLATTEAQERKLLTMEDAILSRQLTPQWCYTGWGTDAKGKTS